MLGKTCLTFAPFDLNWAGYSVWKLASQRHGAVRDYGGQERHPQSLERAAAGSVLGALGMRSDGSTAAACCLPPCLLSTTYTANCNL